MSISKILSEDWTEYDDKKLKGQRDANFFACSEIWEIEYLKKKIKKYYPALTDNVMMSAIKDCCLSVPAPHPRRVFVDCVVRKIEETIG